MVEETEQADVLLDAIFAECHTRWGGRYTLIVPCENGVPRSAYLSWLYVYDPDIIYSYVDLDETTVEKIHERFGPAYLVKHEPHDDSKRDKRYFRPRLPIECLTSLAVVPQYGRAFPASAPQPMTIIDYLPGQQFDRFVDDNFGSPLGCFDWWPLPEHLADVLRPICLASEELLTSPNRGRLPNGDFVPNVPMLLHTLATKRYSFGLAQLAADSVPRIEVRERVNEAFSLVVGDTFIDRIIFWNNRSRFPAYLGREFATLIVSPSALEDDAFFNGLAVFLKARNGVYGSNSTPFVEIKSASLSTEQLTPLRDRFRAADGWNHYYVAAPASLDDVPSAEALENAIGLVTGRLSDTRPPWREFPASGATTRPPAVVPRPLEGLQTASRATQGAWALDVDIERQNNLSRASNVRHHWRLPRRLRMHGAFRKPYEGSFGERQRFPRASKEGFLVLFAGFKEEPPPIDLPDDETAFRYALERGNDWFPGFRKEQRGRPTSAYQLSRPSDKGRYLIGALRLLGGVHNAGSVLLHRFWKEVFDDLGGAVGAARHDIILRTLKKRLKAGSIESDDDWERLASIVAREAQQARMPVRTLGFDKLRERFDPYLEEERKFLDKQRTEDPETWLTAAEATLGRSVQRLCSQSVLYQGYEWKCRTCFHINWAQLDALQPALTCEICTTPHTMSVDKPWDFRLNGFIREALKEHGLLALVWCLVQLQKRARETFFFLGPHDLFETYPEHDRVPADSEMDLLCVVDGKVHLCEVKSSGRDLRIPPLARVAKRIRPDVVTIAVMEARSPRLEARLCMLAEALADTDIDAELINLDEQAFDEDVWLPS